MLCNTELRCAMLRCALLCSSVSNSRVMSDNMLHPPPIVRPVQVLAAVAVTLGLAATIIHITVFPLLALVTNAEVLSPVSLADPYLCLLLISVLL